VSSEEHPALLTPILSIARRRGVRVLRLPISQDPDAMIVRFREILSPRTRLIAVSHVTTDTGTTLPVEEITRMAHERGALVLLDAAHSLGQLEVDVRSLDCDFFAMVGYKWVMGPYPSAALFIKRELLDSIDVTWTGSRATRTSGTMMDLDDLQWIDGAQRFEYGGQPFSYHTAMAEGIAFVSSIGVEAIRDHSRHLAALLHDGVADIPGAHIRSPVDEERRLGIVTIELDAMDGARLSAELRDQFNVITRPALRETSVRFSLAAFTEDSDVTTLVEHLQALVS
jgi:cysteine desulfurase / selenocysteine lyase